MSFTPSLAYRLFLDALVQTRKERGISQEQLAKRLDLPLAQVQAHEAGTRPLGFLDVRAWLLALDMPFVQFTQQVDQTLDDQLDPHQMFEPFDAMQTQGEDASPGVDL